MLSTVTEWDLHRLKEIKRQELLIEAVKGSLENTLPFRTSATKGFYLTRY